MGILIDRKGKKEEGMVRKGTRCAQIEPSLIIFIGTPFQRRKSQFAPLACSICRVATPQPPGERFELAFSFCKFCFFGDLDE